jgi:hypothetical protein
MVQSDGDLDESLEKQFLWAAGFPPDVFPDFMGVVEVSGVEELNPVMEAVRIHGEILAGWIRPGSACLNGIKLVAGQRMDNARNADCIILEREFPRWSIL